MVDYYLRLEGVNQANFVYDTQNLNAMRGGGLLLLDAVDLAKGACNTKGITLRDISLGASSGLFGFSADSDTKAAEVGTSIRDCFHKDSKLHHATLVVDVIPAENDFIVCREKLLAANRWQQMQSPALAVPGKADTTCCGLDLVRPAPKEKRGPGGVPVSESVWQRHEYGRDRKQTFYKKATDLTSLPEFTREFEELAGGAGSFGNLNNKLALFYADGNGFGALQTQKCRSEKDQIAFDTTIRSKRREMLKALIEPLAKEPDWMNHGHLRFETLLWGGDEIIWVVPAWKGWEVAKRFFELTAHWTFAGEKLTHAAGLVFCHCKAPIHRVKRLAFCLAEEAKTHTRTKNLLAVQVLESFDHLGMDPTGYRAGQCPPGTAPHELLLSGETLAQTIGKMRQLRENLPRRQLYTIVRALRAAEPSDELITRAMKELGTEGTAAFNVLETSFGKGPVFWHQLVELWDYIDPAKRDDR